MSDTRTVKVKFTGESTDAQSAMRGMGKEAQNMGEKMQEAGGHFSRMHDTMKNALSVGLGIGMSDLVGTAMEKTKEFFTESVKGATEARKAMAQTEAVLKSTGEVAGISAGHFEELVGKTSKMAGVTEPAVRGYGNLLLTFTQIRGAIFDQAIPAIADMAAALHSDPQTAAIQLGKALNDPVAGMTALKKVGVSFSADQKHVIKDFVATGQVAKAQAVILKEVQTEFGGSAAAIATPMQRAKVAMETFQEEVGAKLLPVLDKLATFATSTLLPAVSAFFQGITGGKGELEGAGKGFAKFGEVVRHWFVDIIIPANKLVWDAVSFVFSAIGSVFDGVSKQLGKVDFKPLADGFKGVGDFIGKYKDVIKPIVVGLVAAGVAMLAWKSATSLWKTVTEAAKEVQIAFNAAADANPIGLIILAIVALVAGIYYAWTHFAGFRVFVIGVWTSIRDAVKPVVAWFMAYVWPVLVNTFNNIVAASIWLWKALKTAFNTIMDVVRPMVAFFLAYVWPFIKFVFEMIAWAAGMLWKAIKAVFDGIVAVVTPVVHFFVTYVWPLIKFVFEMIMWVAGLLWAGIKFAFEKIMEVVRPIVAWFMEHVWPTIRDVFNSIKSHIETVMSAASTAFEKAKDAIGSAWDKIRDLARTPVNFIIDHVYNKGIRAFWNTIAHALPGGPPELPELAMMATGGIVPRWPGVTGDGVPLYGTAGEYMLNLQQVANLGGYRGIEALAGKAGHNPNAGHYASGGIIGGIESAGSWLLGKAGSLAQGTILSVLDPLIKTIRSAISGGIGGGAFGTLLQGVPNKLLDAIISWVRPQDVARATSGGGGGIPDLSPGNIGATQRWIMQQGGKPYSLGSAGPGAYDCSGLVSAVWNLLHGKNPYSHTFSTMDEAGYFPIPGHDPAGLTVGWANAGERGGGSIGHTVGSLAGLAFEAGGRQHNTHFGPGSTNVDTFAHVGHFAASGGGLGRALGGSLGGGGGSLGDWIMQGLSFAGKPSDWAGPLRTLIMRESGGNPNSINLWDSNAKAGHPSQGLMQTIPGTFEAYRDHRLPDSITDPIANIVAGLNYITSRYGSIFNVQQANASRAPMGYKNGGWLMPGDSAYNETREPEAVFNKKQLNSMGGGVTVNVTVQGNVTSETDLATSIATRVRDELLRVKARNGMRPAVI